MKKELLSVLAAALLSTTWPASAQCVGYLIPKEAKVWKDADSDILRAEVRATFVIGVPKWQFSWGKRQPAVRLTEGNLRSAWCSESDAPKDEKTGRVVLYVLEEEKKGLEEVAADPADLRAFRYEYPINPRTQFGPDNLVAIRKAAALALDEIRFKDFKPPEIENQRVFKAPFDATWSALIETMSDQRWQVESVDKGSGLITTKPANDRSGSTMACATKYDEGNIVFLNVFVKAITDGVRVKINATFHATREQKAITCYSNGRLEKELFDGIGKSLAESAPVK